MFGFRVCLLCLTALVLVDLVFVALRSSLTVPRNGAFSMVVLLIIHEVIVVIEMALLARVVMITYWFSAGLFGLCAQSLAVVTPLWVIRLFLTCFPCLYRLYVFPNRHDTTAIDQGTRRPWNDGGYGAVVVLDLLVVIAYCLAALHLLSYLSEKSLYAPYDQQVQTARTWHSLDSAVWTMPANADAAPPHRPHTPRASSAATSKSRLEAGHETPLSASAESPSLSAAATWQRRATLELSAQQAWQTMWSTGELNAPTGFFAGKDSIDGSDDVTNAHEADGHKPAARVRFHPHLNHSGSAVQREATSAFSSRDADVTRQTDNHVAHEASSGSSTGSSRHSSSSRVGSCRTVGPASMRSPLSGQSQGGAASAQTHTSTRTREARVISPSPPQPAQVPAMPMDHNPFFQYDSSSSHRWRRPSNVESALLPAPVHTTFTATATSSSSTAAGPSSVRRASSSADMARAGSPPTMADGRGDPEKGSAIKRFFSFHRHKRARGSDSVAAGPSGVERSPEGGGQPDHTRSLTAGAVPSTTSATPGKAAKAVPTSAQAFGFAFPGSLSYQKRQQQQQQQQQQKSTTASAITPGASSPPLSTRRFSKSHGPPPPRRGSGSDGAAPVSAILSRKDHSSVLFQDDPSMLELQSVILVRGATGPSPSASAFPHGTSATLPPADRTLCGGSLPSPTSLTQPIGGEAYPRPTMAPPPPPPPPSSSDDRSSR